MGPCRDGPSAGVVAVLLPPEQADAQDEELFATWAALAVSGGDAVGQGG